MKILITIKQLVSNKIMKHNNEKELKMMTFPEYQPAMSLLCVLKIFMHGSAGPEGHNRPGGNYRPRAKDLGQL